MSGQDLRAKRPGREVAEILLGGRRKHHCHKQQGNDSANAENNRRTHLRQLNHFPATEGIFSVIYSLRCDGSVNVAPSYLAVYAAAV